MKMLKVLSIFVVGVLLGAGVSSWYWWHVMSVQMQSESIDRAYQAAEEAEWAAQLRLNESSNVLSGLERNMAIKVVTLSQWEDTEMMNEESRLARDKWLVPVKVYHQRFPHRGDHTNIVNAFLAAIPDRSEDSICRSGICRLDDQRLAKLKADKPESK
ncbi:MAG TPA: hypothetical protein EYN66_03095 [Myxococcales bacterium]|nr:hypothetical protein [Myxococcales bacterium]